LSPPQSFAVFAPSGGRSRGLAAVYLKNDGCKRPRRQIYAKFYGQTAAARCADKQNFTLKGERNFTAELRWEFLWCACGKKFQWRMCGEKF